MAQPFALTFKIVGDARKVNTLRQVVKAKLSVLVLQEVVVTVNTTQHDNQYIEDRLGNVPIKSVSPKWVGHEVILKQNNSTEEVKIVTTDDFVVEREGDELLFVPTELRTYDGVVHSLPIQLLDLQPGERIELTCKIRKALTGDNGRYIIAPVCHFKGVMDDAAAAKAYEELPAETKTEEHKKNWDLLYSHQYTVPNSFSFTIETLPNCGYTNQSAVAAACDIIVDGITASRMWKVKVEDHDSSHMEIVMDEFVGYLFENELFGKPGVQFVKYGKRHPHDPTGTLRIKTATSDVNITKLIQECIEPLRRFYVGIASSVGGKRLHASLQKALDSFKRSSQGEKRERLIELGLDRARAESAAEEDLDTMADVWLQQTERKAAPSLNDEDMKVKDKDKDKDVEELKKDKDVEELKKDKDKDVEELKKDKDKDKDVEELKKDESDKTKKA